jgi:UDPglucose 6-dehydrogenase
MQEEAAETPFEMKVTVIGAGYVGLSIGLALAYLGHDVTCVDVDEVKIERLCAGDVPIYEPWLGEMLDQVGDRIRFTTRYVEAVPEADVIFIAVGTASLPTGSPDLQHIMAAAHGIGEHLGKRFTVVVNKSTVPIGSAYWLERLVCDAVESHVGNVRNVQFAVASNPEFLSEGSALHDTLYPDRLVIGTDDPRALQTLRRLYRPILEQSFPAPAFLPRPEGLEAARAITSDPIRLRLDGARSVLTLNFPTPACLSRPEGLEVVPWIATDLVSAELIKYSANAFLALKVSFINEIAQLAERVGADVTQVAKGIGLDPRIGPHFLRAGIGWGGSCFGKDTAALLAIAQEYDLAMPIVKAAREVNYGQRERVVKKLMAELKVLKGRTVGLLGLSFKPHSDDLRDAPALDIARQLIARGAKVKAHDPVALERARLEHPDIGISYCSQPEQVACNADALVLLTEWPAYEELPWEELAPTMRSPLVLDGRNALDRSRLERAGFRYLGMGR